MLNYCHIAAVSPEGVFWFVIIIISIVMQLLKAKRAAALSSESDNKPESGPFSGSPVTELEEFMQSLSGRIEEAVSPQQSPPPPPPRPAQFQHQQGVPAARPAIRQQAKVARRAHSFEPQAPRKKPPAVTAVIQKKEPLTKKQAITKLKQNELRNNIGLDLIKTDGLRKAMLLREILGPPVGLRKQLEMRI